MKSKREILKQFAQGKGCSGILCEDCPFITKGECSLTGLRLATIGAMAILRMFPEKKKPILEVGTKIKFSDGSVATISKIGCDDRYPVLMFKNGHKEYVSYLIGKTWEVVE